MGSFVLSVRGGPAQVGNSNEAPAGAPQQREETFGPVMGLPPGSSRPLQIPICRKRCLGDYWAVE
eukprot:3191139-Lingulodinium_polyedra.AAC.1